MPWRVAVGLILPHSRGAVVQSGGRGLAALGRRHRRPHAQRLVRSGTGVDGLWRDCGHRRHGCVAKPAPLVVSVISSCL